MPRASRGSAPTFWHHDGELAFGTDGDKVEHFAPEAQAAFILETQLGRTVLGQEVFEGGEGDLLVVLGRAPDATWTYEVAVELPSEPFRYAFAPGGTLLVKDSFGAVAIANERKSVALVCD